MTTSIKTGTTLILASAALAFGLAVSSPAHALTMSECSAKYKEAQKAGSLKGMKWNDFRKAECGSDAKPVSTTAAAPAAAPAAKPAATTAKAGNATYPSKVDAKYSKETAGKARMHTCLDQYNANKAKDANGGMKWIQKGGGYYSECNKRLKG